MLDYGAELSLDDLAVESEEDLHRHEIVKGFLFKFDRGRPSRSLLRNSVSKVELVVRGKQREHSRFCPKT